MGKEPYTPKPSLFIVGAMKSGTTTLHRMLEMHPDVYMSTPKEPSYFAGREYLSEIWPEILDHKYSWDLDAYLELFAPATAQQLCGESSTAYAKYPLVRGAAERIFEFQPRAKIIFILREPVARTISHYWHKVRNTTESRPISQLVQEDPQYLAYSDYSTQIEQYLKVFPREQLYIMTLESLQSQSEKTLDELFEWLELSPYSPPELTEKKAHVTPVAIERSRNIRILEWLRRTAVWESMSPHMPNWIRAFGRRLSDEKIDRSRFSAEEFHEAMAPLKQEQIEKLGDLLQRDFPEWEK